MGKPERQKVSIVIPARNEERNLEATVTRTIKSMVDSNIDFEVLLVDDGSSDCTFRIAKNLAAKDSRVLLLKNLSGYGKGLSLRKGFDRACNGVIAMIDADGQHIPEEIPKLIWPILNGEADLVLGSRFLDRTNHVPIRHVLGNKVSSFCFNLLHGTDFADVLMGFRAFNRHAFDPARLGADGYSIEVQMLRSAVEKRVRIVEVPASCLYHRKSSVFRGIRIIVKILASLFSMKFSRK